MNRPVVLILICSVALVALFQNFTVPSRVLPLQKKFESSEVSPAKRFRDLVKYEVGSEVFDKIDELKSKLRIEWGSRNPASETVGPPENETELKKSDSTTYTIASLRTFRIHDQSSELNCRMDSKGLNLVFEKKLSSTASYVLEHDTEQQKSQAKIQFSW